MDPTATNQVPPMELPSVTPEAQQELAEQTQAVPSTEAASAQAIEQGVSQALPVDPASSPTNLGPQPAVATSFDPSQMISPSPQLQTQSVMPAIADDTDLIEKEWVQKAKQIVEQTKSDPHTQNKEMNKVKADYLQKRYNKQIKLVEE